MKTNSTYTPSGRLAAWMDARLPVLRYAHENFTAFPTPRNLNYWWTFGSILMFFLGLQIVTGVVLAMHYTPHADYAFASVEHTMRDVNYGWLLRYLHANGSSMFFLAGYIHIFRGLYYGSYKAPREMIWVIGVFIYVLMMISGFLGYVLPWGQMSFWAATVITNLFGAIPLVGDAVREWLWGGFTVGHPTLNRFFSLHYLVPFILAIFVVLHIWALHVSGNGNPQGVEVKQEQDTVPFHPYYTVKDVFALVVFLVFFAWLVFFAPNALGHPDNYVEANPLSTPAHIVPEWYLAPFYAILRAIPDKLGGVVAMFAAVFILMFVPWLDTSRVRSARFRPIYRQFFLIFVAVCVGLCWLGLQPAEGGYVVAARLLTAWYFLHFLVVLPVLGLVEEPAPVPESLSKPVLAQTGAGP